MKMKTLRGIAVALVLLCTIAGVMADRPNIILIMTDDMGRETLGAHGGTSYRTPVLDRMGAEGLVFDHCYSLPICTPSRVKLMTGRYSFRNYVAFGKLDPAEKTFGNALQNAGYETAIVGKWQLGGDHEQIKEHIGSVMLRLRESLDSGGVRGEEEDTCTTIQ